MGKRLHEHLVDENIKPHAAQFDIGPELTEKIREAREKSLIEELNPPRNKMHITGPASPDLNGLVIDVLGDNNG